VNITLAKVVEKKQHSITIKVTDSKQNIIYEETCNSEKLQMSVLNWKPGTYYVEVIYDDGVTIKRLIVE